MGDAEPIGARRAMAAPDAAGGDSVRGRPWFRSLRPNYANHDGLMDVAAWTEELADAYLALGPVDEAVTAVSKSLPTRPQRGRRVCRASWPRS
jgi:hypothetical protein